LNLKVNFFAGSPTVAATEPMAEGSFEAEPEEKIPLDEEANDDFEDAEDYLNFVQTEEKHGGRNKKGQDYLDTPNRDKRAEQTQDANEYGYLAGREERADHQGLNEDTSLLRKDVRKFMEKHQDKDEEVTIMKVILNLPHLLRSRHFGRRAKAKLRLSQNFNLEMKTTLGSPKNWNS